MQGCQSGARSLNATSELVAAVSQPGLIWFIYIKSIMHLDYLLFKKEEKNNSEYLECKK